MAISRNQHDEADPELVADRRDGLGVFHSLDAEPEDTLDAGFLIARQRGECNRVPI